MASPRTRRLLGELRPKDSNNLCFECGTRNPQWASVSLAIFICLECSGKHRSVGVHLSFVRSLTMDKWKDTELAKMKVGGNDKARKFLESQPDYSSTMPISQKYSTRAAELWRDKVKCESEGRPWDPSKAKVSSSSLYRAKENRSSPALLQGHDSEPSPKLGGLSRDSPTKNTFSSNSYNDISNKTSYNGGYSNSGGYNNNSGGYNSHSVSSGYNNSEVYTYGGNTQLQARDQFLANKMQENQSRSDHLPPSQGGKYVGFGSTPAPQPRQANNEYMDTLSYWGSALATGATSLARAAGEKALEVNENYIKPTAAKVADPAFQANVKQSLTNMSSKAAQLGSQGATLLASYSEKGWNSVNERVGNRGYSYGNSVSNNSYSNTSSGFGSGGGGGGGSGYQSDSLNDPTSLSSNMSNMSVNDPYSASSYSAGNSPYNSQVTNRTSNNQDIFGMDSSSKKQEATGDLDEWLNDGWDEDWKTESKPRSRRKKTGGKGD